jgi:hypothetical protein
MIRQIRELICRYKNAYIKNKINSLNYSTSLNTSCAIPVIRMKRKIWMVESVCLDTFQIEHNWFENETHLSEHLIILKTLDCLYDIKEYDIEL